jgi:hypothetical protein
MPTYDPSDEEPVRCRSRREYEDGLLNSRSNLFLVVNGLGAVAFRMPSGTNAQLVISFATFAINLLWITCAVQSWWVIRAMTIEYCRLAKGDRIDQLVRDTLGDRWRLWLRPTNVMAIYLPALVEIGWFVVIVALLVS